MNKKNMKYELKLGEFGGEIKEDSVVVPYCLFGYFLELLEAQLTTTYENGDLVYISEKFPGLKIEYHSNVKIFKNTKTRAKYRKHHGTGIDKSIQV